MPRLRLTTSLSLLALLIGVIGTAWLSALTDRWPGPAPGMARAMTHWPPAAALRHAARHRFERVVRAPGPNELAAEAGPVAAPRTLTPLDTPAGPTPYVALRGHLDGRVVLHVDVDGAGRVADAAVERSSGDPILDAHALATVRRWRFAVPAGHPEGVSGQLPMRFDSGTRAGTPP